MSPLFSSVTYTLSAVHFPFPSCKKTLALRANRASAHHTKLRIIHVERAKKNLHHSKEKENPDHHTKFWDHAVGLLDMTMG